MHLDSRGSLSKKSISKPCRWTPESPPFWVLREDGEVFAVFENFDRLVEFEMMHPHVFALCKHVEQTYSGLVRLYLGYLQ